MGAAFFIPFVIFLWRFMYNPKREERNSKLKNRIENFVPKHLIDETEDDSDKKDNTSIYVPEDSPNLIDLARVNYLNLLNNNDIKESAIECVKNYGVGTNGPRGFFGTTEIHLNVEKALAEFLGTEDAIVYAYGFTTISSVIMAYCKAGDLIFCDEAVNYSVKQGVIMSKSEPIYFRHNNTEDLVEKLKENEMRDKRKFLIVEGLYSSDGTLCKLVEILKVVKEYKLFIFLDESLSFGVVGVNGRGVTEHFNVNIKEIDVIIGSLENCLGSIGGFCAGSNAIIEHQRLFSASYVYSASLPTFLNQVAIDVLPIVKNKAIFLQILATKFQEFLFSLPHIRVINDAISPMKIIRHEKEERRKRVEEAIFEYCRDRGVYMCLNSNGITMHLNVDLYFNKGKLEQVYEIIRRGVEVSSKS